MLDRLRCSRMSSSGSRMSERRRTWRWGAGAEMEGEGEGEGPRMRLEARERVDFLCTRERREWVERRLEVWVLLVLVGAAAVAVGVVENRAGGVGVRRERAELCFLISRARPPGARRDLRLGLRDGVG